MKFDAIIFEGESLTDYAETDTPAIRLNGLTLEEVSFLTKLVYRQGQNLFICCLPDTSEE